MKYIYVVVSATNSKMGKFIRHFTHTPFNHVSISFDDHLNDMISFARYYYQAPFFGGYIHESSERYQDSKIVLYKVFLDEKVYNRIKNEIKQFDENDKDYLYHTINAFLSPFNKEIYIEKAYTCLSFTMYLLHKTNLNLPNIYSIKQLMNYLEPYIIYEGSIKNFCLNSNPSYFKKISYLTQVSKTFKQHQILLNRFLS